MATKKTTSRTRAGAAKKTTTRKTTARKTTTSTRATKSVQIPEVMPTKTVSRLTLGTTNKVEEDTAVTPTDAVEAPVAEDTTPETEDAGTPEFRRPELIEKVMERSGMKRKDVKPVVEAMLAVMGDLLVEETDMNIAPLGKVMVKNAKELEKAHVLTVKVRRPKQLDAVATEE